MALRLTIERRRGRVVRAARSNHSTTASLYDYLLSNCVERSGDESDLHFKNSEACSLLDDRKSIEIQEISLS